MLESRRAGVGGAFDRNQMHDGLSVTIQPGAVEGEGWPVTGRQPQAVAVEANQARDIRATDIDMIETEQGWGPLTQAITTQITAAVRKKAAGWGSGGR
jgi:hypothetical protein